MRPSLYSSPCSCCIWRRAPGHPGVRSRRAVHSVSARTLRGHWGGVHISNGRAIVAQRFAIDVVGLDENGVAVVGDVDRTTNEDWFGFGAEVIAVAEGVVRAIRDGVSDRPPLAQSSPLDEVTLEAAAGNYVVLELGTNTFALYAHLQRDSVAVEVGQRVRRGDMLGRLGNSGNTNGAHLHFHVSDAPGLEGEGLPFLIDSFGFLGETTTNSVVPDWTDSEPPRTGSGSRPPIRASVGRGRAPFPVATFPVP